MKYLYRTLLILLLSISTSSLAFAIDQNADKKVLEQLLQTIAQRDYQAFTQNNTASVNERVSQQLFERYTAQLGKLIRNGYRAEYMGVLQQRGREASLWKLTFATSKDEMLARIVLIDGKIAGFSFI